MRGHGLLFEGRPVEPARRGSSNWILFQETADGAKWTLIEDRMASEGVGVCRCGEVSDLLPSGNARKRWHRWHKDALRREANAEDAP